MNPRDIAIVGVACRYPDSSNPDQLWNNLVSRRSSFRPIPKNRWDHSLYYVEGRTRDTYTTYCDRAALLEHPYAFDGPGFDIAPLRAESMDPQQRIMLELAREALQDAGLDGNHWDRSLAASFLGVSTSEFSLMCSAPLRARQLASGQFGEPFERAQALAASSRFGPARSYSLPGSLQSMCATNLSQVFDFRGPAFTIDSACASSLTAVVQAVHYLRSAPNDGPAPVALAGGIFMMMVPDALIGFSRIGAVAAHECRPFDADSAGFLMGEGGGVVILKRLSDALRDGNPVYAILRGVAWNSDGRADNPMTVGLEGHAHLIELGLRDCGLQLDDFGYVECHGTATRTGDTVELQSLAHHLKGSTRPFLGSIKANIGHTMSAAGVAGLLRAVLALHHREIPPQANWSTWHPDLSNLQDRFRIPTRVQPWDQPLPRALVSSFGFGGTNALVALQAPDQPARPASRPLPGPRPIYRPYKAEDAEPEGDISLPQGPGVLQRLLRLELEPPFVLEDLDLDGGRARRTAGGVPPRVGEPSGLGVPSELDALLPASVRVVRMGCCEVLGDEPLELYLNSDGAHLVRRGRLAAWLEFEPGGEGV